MVLPQTRVDIFYHLLEKKCLKRYRLYKLIFHSNPKHAISSNKDLFLALLIILSSHEPVKEYQGKINLIIFFKIIYIIYI